MRWGVKPCRRMSSPISVAAHSAALLEPAVVVGQIVVFRARRGAINNVFIGLLPQNGKWRMNGLLTDIAHFSCLLIERQVLREIFVANLLVNSREYGIFIILYYCSN